MIGSSAGGQWWDISMGYTARKFNDGSSQHWVVTVFIIPVHKSGCNKWKDLKTKSKQSAWEWIGDGVFIVGRRRHCLQRNQPPMVGLGVCTTANRRTLSAHCQQSEGSFYTTLSLKLVRDCGGTRNLGCQIMTTFDFICLLGKAIWWLLHVCLTRCNNLYTWISLQSFIS